MVLENSIEQRLNKRLLARQQKGVRRALQLYPGDDFCSNDYLGLAQNTEPANARLNNGSTGSRLISGNSRHTEEFEQGFARHHGFEHSLLFSSGYAANSGLLACIAQHDDLLILDALAHASLIDGARLSRAPYLNFAHNDLADLTRLLDAFENTRTSPEQQVFVVVESLYSMDGDQAPLQQLVELCQRYKAALIVDEAHALGVYGEHGAGLIAQLNLQAAIFAAIFTFGKAMGSHGAVIAGSSILRDYLVNYCRPFIYTTAPSPQTVATLDKAHQQLCEADSQRQALQNNIAYFSETVKSARFNNAYWLESDSPIQALIVGDAQGAKDLGTHLSQAGFALKAIVSPTVPLGSERIRICLHSTNTYQQIDRFACVLQSHLAGAQLVNGASQ